MSFLDEPSKSGVYAKDPTLPEEMKIYDVDKTKNPSAVDIVIATIAWTAAPSIISPLQHF